jgi:hypothetical protein
MSDSKQIAKLLGPALIGITVTEWINLDVFRSAIGPAFAAHVYLSGTLLFIAGLAIIRAHNIWSRRWSVLITIVGWLGVVAGLGRMAAPLASQEAERSDPIVYSSLVTLFAIGVVLSYNAFSGQDA